MPKLKLTARTVERLRAPTATGRQTLYRDEAMPGLGLLASGVSTTKTYVVQGVVGGKERRVTIGRADVLSLADARGRAKAVLADFLLGHDPKSTRGGLTLRAALDGYLAARKTLRPKTVSDYRDVIEKYLTPWVDLRLKDITADMVEKRHRSLQSEVAARGRHAGNAIANGALRAFGTVYGFAAEREPGLPPNPVTRLKRQWFPVERRTRIVRAAEMPTFYRAVVDLPNTVQRDYLLLLLFTGLRRTEAATLTWDDVDFSSNVIRIPAARTKAGRKLDLPMTDVVHDTLVARRAIGKDKYVFPATGGHISEPKFPLGAVARATGIKVSAHDLRRTYATIAESCDISVMALKALINHSAGSDVTSGYVQINAERLREPAQRVANKIKDLCGITSPEGVVALR